MNNWQTIWNKRKHQDTYLDLDTLIRLDGFDGGAGAIEARDWRQNTRAIASQIGIEDHTSVFEVGCGAGAFLKALQEFLDVRVGGIDYAGELVNTARKAIPDGDFAVVEAANMDIDNKYDFVISNSVFHYMPYDYARRVLTRMLAKAVRGVAILEVPDRAFMEESERIRQDALSPEEYRKKYEGLEHSYFDREWFREQVDTKQFNCRVTDGTVPNYKQSRFRFNVYITPIRNGK